MRLLGAVQVKQSNQVSIGDISNRFLKKCFKASILVYTLPPSSVTGVTKNKIW